ncbi:MAG: GNAT family N-acetyltransferase [Myxococcales bacterium]|nr:GNAT family N-acetyltransferase [Myxococcales bacterium]
MTRTRVRIAWTTAGLELVALEPTAGELAAHAEELAAAYNDPANATLLGHVDELTQGDVIEAYADLADEGARQFLLYVDGALAGDGDLRGLEDRAAEFAFLIGRPNAQGKGLGTRFAQMIHAFGFAAEPAGLGLERIYASVVPDNVASLRVFGKLGYREDHSVEARAWADAPEDIVLAIDRTVFSTHHAAALAEIVIAAR